MADGAKRVLGTWAGLALLAAGLALALFEGIHNKLYGAAKQHPRLQLGALALVLIGCVTFWCALFVPLVDGTVVRHTRGKGSSYWLEVDQGGSTVSVLGNSDVRPCAPGSHLVKAAWGTAYRCGEEVVGAASVGVYFAAVAFVALSGLVLNGVVGPTGRGRGR
jgi:hypothetical protein